MIGELYMNVQKDKSKSDNDSLMNSTQVANYAKKKIKQAKNSSAKTLQRQWEAVYYDTQHDPTLKAYTHDVKHGTYAQRVDFKLPKMLNENLDVLSRRVANRQILINGRPRSRKQQIANIRTMQRVSEKIIPDNDKLTAQKQHGQEDQVIHALQNHKSLSLNQKALVQRANIVKNSVDSIEQNSSKPLNKHAYQTKQRQPVHHIQQIHRNTKPKQLSPNQKTIQALQHDLNSQSR